MSPHWADVLVGSSVADFLLREWKQAGRVPLRVAEIGLEEIAVPEQPVKLIRDTVASLRLDSVAAAGFSISRSAAAELIRSGKAEVNWMPCIRPDFSVEQGDVLTIRGPVSYTHLERSLGAVLHLRQGGRHDLWRGLRHAAYIAA